MFTFRVRLLLIVASVAYGIFRLTAGNPIGWAFLAAAALFVFGYFRYGTVRPAFVAMVRGDFERVETLIASIRFPNLLSSQSRAYLHWIEGVLAAQNATELGVAPRQLDAAYELGVRTKNDQCVLVCAMAEVAMLRNDKDRASSLLQLASELRHSEVNTALVDGLAEKLAAMD